MESGKKAVVIIIIAMLITSGVGFFLNFDKQSVKRTEYTPIGNMDALMSANSGRTQESELYNSTYNVTNWKVYDSGTNQWIPNPDIVRLPSGQANSYIITDEYETPENTNISLYMSMYGYTTNVRTNYDYGGVLNNKSDDHINEYEGFNTTVANKKYWPQNYDKMMLGSSAYSVAGGPLIGGYGQLNHAVYTHYGLDLIPVYNVDRDTYLRYNYNGQLISYGDNQYLIYVPLSVIVNMDNIITTETYHDKFEVRFDDLTGMEVYSDLEISAEFIVGTVVIDGAQRVRRDYLTINIDTQNPALNDTLEYLRYDVNTKGWVGYDENNRRIGTMDEVYVIINNPSISTIDVTLTHYAVTPATYADPTKYVPIDETSIWTNYDMDLTDPLNPHTTFVNTEVSILVKGTGTIDIGGIANQPTNYNILNAVTITKSGSMYVVNGVSIGDYLGLRITLSALTNSITVEGIVTDNSPIVDGGSGGANTPTYNYELSGVSITVPHSYNMPDLYRLRFTPGTDMQAYIEDTYILSDPNQVLWKDIDINIGNYFPDEKSHLRLLLQGFVRYGDKIYINETNPSSANGYTVVDGKFTITYSVPGSATKRATFALNGTAIDFYNNHVYVVQTNGKTQVDLGPIQTYAVKMTGVWYFSTTASTISVYDGEEHVWTPGWSMDLNTTILTFVGTIFGSLVIMAMRFRDELEVMDIIVLILTMVISLSLLVIS